MDQFRFDLFFDRIGYYQILLVGFALAGLLGFSNLTKEQKKNESVRLSLAIVVTVAFYEMLATVFSSQKIINQWVYNLFNSHLSAILFVLLIRSFLRKKSHKKAVNLLIVLFFLISVILHLTGITQLNDAGEYLSFVNTILIVCCCGFYFFELITQDEFLDINPLREFSFWASTAILFYFSSSFMIYISLKYLYTNHLEIFYMVMKIPIHMTLLCNLLLCLSIYSLIIKERFQVEIIHVWARKPSIVNSVWRDILCFPDICFCCGYRVLHRQCHAQNRQKLAQIIAQHENTLMNLENEILQETFA